MGSLLNAQRAVRVRSLDRECRGLDPCLLGIGGVVHLSPPPVPFAIARVHATEHLGPVRGINTTRFCADRDECLTRVVLTREQCSHFELVDRLLNLVQLVYRFGESLVVTLILGQLEKDGKVVNATAQSLYLANLPLHIGELRGDRLRLLLVIPQIGRRGLGLEVRKLQTQGREVENLLDAAQGVADGRDALGCFDGCHGDESLRDGPVLKSGP